MQYNHDLQHCLHSPQCCQGNNKWVCHCCCRCCCWKYLTPSEFCCLNRRQFKNVQWANILWLFSTHFVVSFSCFAARHQKENEDHSSRDRWIFGCLEDRRAEVCFTHSTCKNKYLWYETEARDTNRKVRRIDPTCRLCRTEKHDLRRSESYSLLSNDCDIVASFGVRTFFVFTYVCT